MKSKEKQDLRKVDALSNIGIHLREIMANKEKIKKNKYIIIDTYMGKQWLWN